MAGNISADEDTFVGLKLLKKMNFCADFKFPVFNERNKTLLAMQREIKANGCGIVCYTMENGTISDPPRKIYWGEDRMVTDLVLVAVGDTETLIVSTVTIKRINVDNRGIETRFGDPKLWESDFHTGGNNLIRQLDTSAINEETDPASLCSWKNFLIANTGSCTDFIHVFVDLKYHTKVSIPFENTDSPTWFMGMSVCGDRIVFKGSSISQRSDHSTIFVFAWSFETMTIGEVICEIPTTGRSQFIFRSGKIITKQPRDLRDLVEEYSRLDLQNTSSSYFSCDRITFESGTIIVYDVYSKNSRTVPIPKNIGDDMLLAFNCDSTNMIVTDTGIYEMI